jgi:hypothetical protein
MHIQKFNQGDLVLIADNLAPSKSHFKSGVLAIIEGSYADLCRGGSKDNITSYSLIFEGGGTAAWYDESELTLIARRRTDLMDAWLGTNIIEVVINSCYGGFQVSDYVLEELRVKESYLNNKVLGIDDPLNPFAYRASPDLIAAIKSLGDAANTAISRLKIIGIPCTVNWTIEGREGLEQIREISRVWG